MRRKTFDAILTAGGGVLFVVLIVAGIFLTLSANFANSNVHSQLAEQAITFPPASAFAHAKPGTEITPGMRPYLLRYAGQPLTTGPEAKAYADHFIAVHLSEMPYGGVYSKASAAAQADPTNAKLQGLVNTIFKGTTLRGLLLEAYAFSVFGEIATWASIAVWVLAGVMAVLTILGVIHQRRTAPTAEM
jgi:hypothetical protein